jgi:A1 cistron-splicing factor AAR2
MAQERGGVLVVTDPPPTFDFGIDCMSYETRADFRGVCMVPAGLHFVYWSTGMGARQGFFLHFSKDEVVVKSWDAVVEDLLPTHTLSDWSLSNLHQAIHRGELDANLGPYPIDTSQSWHNISNYVSVPVLALVGLALGVPIFPGDLDALPPKARAELNLQAVQPYFPNAARVAHFCDLKGLEEKFLGAHRDIFRNQTARSHFHLDRSALLSHLLAVHYQSWENLLGELQVSFLLFMLLYSHPALEHWKHLVNLLCASEEALTSHPRFTCGFLRTFYEQLHYSPDDFFETEISRDNFLRPALSSLFENLGDSSMADGEPVSSLDQHVKEHRNRLFTFAQKKFGLYVEETSSSLPSVGAERFTLVDEDLPVVVTEQELMGLDRYNSTDQVPPISSSSPSHSQSQPSPTHTPGTGSNTSLQEGLFSWRYPLLFDEMRRHNGSQGLGEEDMVMSAMRILDEIESPAHASQEASSDHSLRSLRVEAVKFLENEVSLWSAGTEVG